MRYEAVLFDAAETLFTTLGTVGEIYAEVAHRYGSTTTASAIQDAFIRQFRHSGPLTTDNEKQWWKDVVYRVFDDVGMVNNFDPFFEDVYEQFRSAASAETRRTVTVVSDETGDATVVNEPGEMWEWQTFLTPPCAPIAIDMADMASFVF